MAAVWDTLLPNQRQYLGELAAGKRQITVLNSLLSNWESVDKAVQNATDSLGSASIENAKYIDSIEGKLKSLDSAFSKLATKTIDGDLIKSLVDLVTGFVNVTEASGGLLTILALIATLFSSKIIAAFGVLKKTLIELTAGMKLFRTGMDATKASATGLFSVISLGIVAISAIIGWISSYNEKQREMREEIIRTGEEEKEKIKTLNDLVLSYEKLNSVENKSEEQENALISAGNKLEETLSIRAGTLKNLTEGTSDYNSELERQLRNEREIQLITSNAAVTAMEQNFSSKDYSFGGSMFGQKGVISDLYLSSGYKEAREIVTRDLEEFRSIIYGDYRAENITEAPAFLKAIDETLLDLERQATFFGELGGEINDEIAKGIRSSEFYTGLSELRTNLKTSVQDYANSLVQVEIVTASLNNTLPKNTEELKKFKDTISSSIDPTGEFTDIIVSSVDSFFSFQDASTGYISQTEAISSTVSQLKSDLTDLNDVYSLLAEAEKEYEESKVISLETLEKLLALDSEYLEYLIDENGNIKLNAQAYKDLALAKAEDLKLTLLQKKASEEADLAAALRAQQDVAYGEEKGSEERTEEFEKYTEMYYEVQQELERLNQEYENGIILIDAYIAGIMALGETTEDTKLTFEDISSALDEAQSAYETLTSAIDEYNKTGDLSVDTFQALMALSPEFLQMFFNQATAAGNAEAAIYAQAEAVRVAKLEEIQAAAATDLMNLALGNVDGMSALAQSAVAGAGNSAATAGGKALTAAGKFATMASSLRDVWSAAKGQAGTISTASLEKQANAIISSYSNLAKNISSISIGSVGGGSSGGGGGGSSAATDQAKTISDAYDNLLSYTMSMLKKEQQDRIDQLEEELDVQEELYNTEKDRIEAEIDGYKKIIDKKKESLKLDKEEKEYNDDIADVNKEISDLQDRLIELAFDTSESAKAERLKLQEELSEKETDLADKQYDRGIDLAENALDIEYELYEDQQEQKLNDLEEAFEATKTDYEDRIELLEEYLEQENTIRSEAIALIEGRSEEFYNRLYEWNEKYGEVTSAVLQSIIDLAHQTVEAVSSASGSGSGGSSKTVTKTIEEEVATSPVTTGTLRRLETQGIISTHHSGLDAGFVGGLKGNEEFVKALKGEVYINPKQQNDYMNKILPETINSSKNNIRCENLLSITVAGNIDSNSVQKIQKTVENEFQKLNKVFSGMGTTRKANSFAT